MNKKIIKIIQIIKYCSIQEFLISFKRALLFFIFYSISHVKSAYLGFIIKHSLYHG